MPIAEMDIDSRCSRIRVLISMPNCWLPKQLMSGSGANSARSRFRLRGGLGAPATRATLEHMAVMQQAIRRNEGGTGADRLATPPRTRSKKGGENV